MASWWCMSGPSVRKDADGVETKLKVTLDVTENWIDICKARRAQNEKQRLANAQRRRKLEADRMTLLDSKVKAQEALNRIQSELEGLDELMVKLQLAEQEIASIERDITHEENEMRDRESSIKNHLQSISILATPTTSRGSPLSNASPMSAAGLEGATPTSPQRDEQFAQLLSSNLRNQQTPTPRQDTAAFT